MPKKQPSPADLGRTKLDWVQKVIKLENIDPSPYQRRRYFDEDKLKELACLRATHRQAASIEDPCSKLQGSSTVRNSSIFGFAR